MTTITSYSTALTYSPLDISESRQRLYFLFKRQDSHYKPSRNVSVKQQLHNFFEPTGGKVQLQAKLLMPADARELCFVYQTLLAGSLACECVWLTVE